MKPLGEIVSGDANDTHNNTDRQRHTLLCYSGFTSSSANNNADDGGAHSKQPDWGADCLHPNQGHVIPLALLINSWTNRSHLISTVSSDGSDVVERRVPSVFSD